MRISSDGWIVIGLIVAAVCFTLMLGSGRPQESDLSTSYSNDASGTKAVYTLLGDRLGYNVDRLEQPYDKMPQNAAVLVCVAPLPTIPINADERDALDNWIRKGGTAIFISDSLENIPAHYGSTRPFGKGFIYALNSRRVITNRGARDYRNTMEFLNIVAEHDLSPALY